MHCMIGVYAFNGRTHFFPLKPHFLMVILPLSAMCFMVLRGFIYTIAMYVYAFRLVFSGK